MIDADAPAFVARPFGCVLFSPVRRLVHWDCFAAWDGRAAFARDYFGENVAAIRRNPYWGVARCDDRVLLTVNPARYVGEADVLLAATGSSFRVPLDEWAGWVAGGWFEACRHQVEREALGELIPVWRDGLASGEEVAAAAGFAPGDEPGPEQSPMVERLSYEFACQAPGPAGGRPRGGLPALPDGLDRARVPAGGTGLPGRPAVVPGVRRLRGGVRPGRRVTPGRGLASRTSGTPTGGVSM